MTTNLLALVLGIVLALIDWFWLRQRYRYWGATDEEIHRAMPGDAEVPRATYDTTLAVTVDAPAGDLWPWLVQMGYRRGGLYSYDWLDRLFGYLDAPSAQRILPECQRLQIGDVIPVGRGGGFPVTALEPLRALVLGGEGDGFHWVWQFGLYPVGRGRTRLVSRNRASLPRSVGSTLFMWILEPAAFIMTRKMLLGLKRRAEATAAHGTGMASSRHDATRRVEQGHVAISRPATPIAVSK